MDAQHTTCTLLVDLACLLCVAVNQSAATPYYLFDGYAHLAAGLSCGLAGLAAGMAIGIVGDAGVRQVCDCCLVYAALLRKHSIWQDTAQCTHVL